LLVPSLINIRSGEIATLWSCSLTGTPMELQVEVADITADDSLFRRDSMSRRVLSHWHTCEFDSWTLLVPPLTSIESGEIATF
jgi:hypothetical protein